MKRASYSFNDPQKAYLLKKAHDLGITVNQLLRMIVSDYKDKNPVRA